jgi:hypothetical protein
MRMRRTWRFVKPKLCRMMDEKVVRPLDGGRVSDVRRRCWEEMAHPFGTQQKKALRVQK